VLFASIVEPDIVSYLFALDASRIHPVDVGALTAQASSAATEPSASTVCEDFGPWRLEVTGDRATLTLASGAPAAAVEARAALLACLERGASVELCWSGVGEVDLALAQVIFAAALTFARRGTRIRALWRSARGLVPSGRAGRHHGGVPGSRGAAYGFLRPLRRVAAQADAIMV